MSLDLFMECCIKRMRERGRSKRYIEQRRDDLRDDYQQMFEDIECEGEIDQIDHLESSTLMVLSKEDRISELSKHYQIEERKRNISFFPHNHRVEKVNEPVKYGKTPLILAAATGDLKLVMELIEQGANLSHRDNNRHNAQQVAEIEGHHKLAKILQRIMNE